MRITVLLLAAVSCQAQTSAGVSLSNGVQLTISNASDNARSDNAGSDATPLTLKSSLEPASGDSFYRIFRDENNLAVFAYELEVVRTQDGQNFRISAKPATEAFATRYPNADGGKPTPTLSAVAESPLLHSGERFTIPIPTNPGLGQDLTDVIQIRVGERGGANNGAAGSAQIRFAGLKVYIQDKSASPTGAGSDVAGRYAMFYLPGHGGYFFSTEAVDERPFQQVGVVDGKHLTFTIDNETYDATATAPILVHADRGQLWVYHDPNYKPAGNWTKRDPTSNKDEYFTAAADSMQWWVQ
jgi:hypothetical protein